MVYGDSAFTYAVWAVLLYFQILGREPGSPVYGASGIWRGICARDPGQVFGVSDPFRNKAGFLYLHAGKYQLVLWIFFCALSCWCLQLFVWGRKGQGK